jgi:hypothetical protein
MHRLKLADVPGCRTGRELQHHIQVMKQQLWERVRSFRTSPHMKAGSKLFDYTRIPRNVLPAVAHTNVFHSEGQYPFLSYESMALIRAARDVFQDRKNRKKKFAELQGLMASYIATGNGTVEQAFVWSSANARKGGPGADVLYTKLLLKGRKGSRKSAAKAAAVAV